MIVLNFLVFDSNNFLINKKMDFGDNNEEKIELIHVLHEDGLFSLGYNQEYILTVKMTKTLKLMAHEFPFLH